MKCRRPQTSTRTFHKSRRIADSERSEFTSTMPQDATKPGGYVTGYNEYTSSRYGGRDADSSCAYLLPYLEKLPPTFTFLDVGCGPGSITVDLAARFPSAQFTGIDLSEFFLSKANSLASEKNVSNVKF